MATSLNLFPARVPIGQVQPDGRVLMTMEFSRALSDLMLKLGGYDSFDQAALEVLANTGSADALALGLAGDVQELTATADPHVAISAMGSTISDLRNQIEQPARAETLRQAVDDIQRQLAMLEDPAAQVRYLSGMLGKKQDKITPPTVTGSRAGNAALASLLTGLAGQGLIVDSTTP